MILLMIVLFLIGYICIAMEHTTHVNKAAPALIMAALLWTLYVINAESILVLSPEFQHFVGKAFNVSPSMEGWNEFVTNTLPSLPDLHERCISYVTGTQIIEHLGDTASTLFFLMGAMTIVELIDVHGGFSIITDHITTKKKRKLLWIIASITFCLSAILDNLTTTIVMVMLLRKLISDSKERWLFACMVVIAANSGGAFSPIGDVTTIMLWVRGNITTGGVVPSLIIPSIISVVVPAFIVSLMLKGEISSCTESVDGAADKTSNYVDERERNIIFFLGVGALIFVPIFKSITHLPPFIGILLGVGVLWTYTDIMYLRKHTVPANLQGRINNVLSRIDLSTIMFFLGILMAVAALQCSGILHQLSMFLDETVGNIYIINIIIGILSSIVDNVPLVAGAMGMYDGVYAADSPFWLFLAYCAGVGGSMLIIGSAAGVVVMGLEKVDFFWYVRKITWLALIGYLVGAFYFIFQELVLIPMFQ
ncbi:MAG: sodium:proton antiporter NhaD [Marinilabiliaceae bacterium]|nr:sodium:proton antiporter NhaD [Marinilabiliaceae bacterium]